MSAGQAAQSEKDRAFNVAAIVIYGGGGHAKTLIDLVRAAGVYQLVGVVDDGLAVGTDVLGLPVLGGAEKLTELAQQGVSLAVNAVGGIGNIASRLRVFEKIAQAGFTCPNLVHPSAWVEPSVRLEGGVQVLAKAYISSDSRIGFGTVINAGVVVSHDCQVGQVVNLSPGAMLAGGVVIEDHVQVGMAATLNINVHIGRGARIGNGATVKKDVPEDGIVHAGEIWPVWGELTSRR
jgi:sugar O-acyltransferase (sialic acid O-acetyltransferase NeuD family)